jgi:hypothetical protein
MSRSVLQSFCWLDETSCTRAVYHAFFFEGSQVFSSELIVKKSHIRRLGCHLQEVQAFEAVIIARKMPTAYSSLRIQHKCLLQTPGDGDRVYGVYYYCFQILQLSSTSSYSVKRRLQFLDDVRLATLPVQAFRAFAPARTCRQ